MVDDIPLRLSLRTRLFVTCLCLLWLPLVGLIDLATGPKLSLSIFYILPIAAMSWFGSHRTGLVFAALSTIAWFLADHFGGRPYSNAWLACWNSLVRLTVLATFSYLVAKVRFQLEREAKLARRDFLTGLPNNQSFLELAAQEMKLASGFHPMTLAHIKVDGLRWVNHRFGIVAGDQLVCAIAQTIKANVPRQELVGRLGGTVFGILLPDRSSNAANLILEKIRQDLGEQKRKYQRPLTFFISAITYNKIPNSVAELMHEAERRLDQAGDDKKDTLRIEVVESSQLLN